METTTSAGFPLDYREWREAWRKWIARQESAGTLRPTRGAGRFPGRNILADRILGRWTVNAHGRLVELAEGTFPDLISGRGRHRFVGITWADASTHNGMRSGGTAHSFEVLSASLAAGRELTIAEIEAIEGGLA